MIYKKPSLILTPCSPRLRGLSKIIFSQMIYDCYILTINKFMQIINKYKINLVNIVLLLALLVTAIGFLVDLYNTFTYIGTDLRNRVVGARLIIEGIDPYFFKWIPGLSDRLYDPLDNPSQILSKVSVPPTVLALHSIMARLPYMQQKVLWLIVEWAAFAGIVSIFIKTNTSRLKRNSILIVSFFLLTVYSGVFI